MKVIAISATLRDQDVDALKNIISALSEQNPHAILIHGYMPLDLVKARGWDTSFREFLDDEFPLQLNMFHPEKGVLRDEMAYIAARLNAHVYILGDMVYGVKEEFDAYDIWQRKGALNITHLAIPKKPKSS